VGILRGAFRSVEVNSNPSSSEGFVERDRDEVCDVLIIGAGMAGGLLARQLSVEQPDLRVIVLDQKTDFDGWVGESTVEVFDDYAVRTCRLGPNRAAQHLVKHGLRYWFDSPQKNLRMCELSEQGRSRYTTLNRGVQLDRARFDRDLCEINRRNGVEVLLGTKVAACNGGGPGIVIRREGEHVVHTSHGKFRCRHLVDAGGRSSPLARQLDLVPGGDERAPVGSYWGRFRGTRSIDELGDDTWRARVENTLRWASTNHFMYDGYWIWLIPVDANTVSLGVTFDRRIEPLKIRNGSEFEAFLRGHRCMDELLRPEAALQDFRGLSHISRGARQYFSEDRWYLTGMSGLFVDPLFSNMSAVIALSNRMIASMIEADRNGDSVRFRRRRRHFDIAMRNIYLRQRNAYDKYEALGSFDAFVNWQTLRYHSILNYDIPAQHADHRPMIERVDSHDEDCGCAVGAWSESQQLGIAGDRLALEFTEFIDARGQYYARNAGYFHEKTERAETRRKTVELDFGPAVRRESLLNWEAFVRYYLMRMCEMDSIPFDEDSFVRHFQTDWNAGQTLDELLDVMRRRRDEGQLASPPPVRWDLKGPIDERTAAESAWWCRFLGPDGRQVPACGVTDGKRAKTVSAQGETER
jgi:flavin-dependent dehydrogenase